MVKSLSTVLIISSWKCFECLVMLFLPLGHSGTVFRFHAERAIDIITHILPEDHLLLASSKRVKGTAVRFVAQPLLFTDFRCPLQQSPRRALLEKYNLNPMCACVHLLFVFFSLLMAEVLVMNPQTFATLRGRYRVHCELCVGQRM